MLIDNMKILIYAAHPAQFYFFKNAIKDLEAKGFRVLIVIKSKDVLSELLDTQGFKYYNILLRGRGSTKAQIFGSLLLRDIKLFWYSIKNHVDLFMGTDASLAHVAFLSLKPSQWLKI